MAYGIVNAGGVPPVATETSDGLMSAADKAKIDSAVIPQYGECTLKTYKGGIFTGGGVESSASYVRIGKMVLLSGRLPRDSGTSRHVTGLPFKPASAVYTLAGLNGADEGADYLRILRLTPSYGGAIYMYEVQKNVDQGWTRITDNWNGQVFSVCYETSDGGDI